LSATVLSSLVYILRSFTGTV